MEKTRKKLLYVAPHLSTGGQPQYLVKQIQHFINDFHIEVVEINNSGGDAFVVQKNRIKNMCILHTLGQDKSEILNIIDEFKPDIIHFQEIPQHDLGEDILKKIFRKERPYFILATTHGSLTNPSEIVFHPDKYVLVSKWSKQVFEDANLGVPIELWEYPIENYQYDKEEAKKKLGFELDWKHVVNVGLFAPGKNQAEIFKIARQLEKYKIKFHFVGNQAMNFEHYWLPLMKHKPENCIVHGERDDVDSFLAAADMFYFASTLELMPLSIKEALSYGLPSIFRRLYTYLDTYDEHPLVTYIDDDLNKTKKIILDTLKPSFNEIPGWFAFKDLYDEAVDKAPYGANFVEIGTWFGKSTNYLAKKIVESKKDIHLTAIDTFKGTPGAELDAIVLDAFNGDIFYDFIDNVNASGNYDKFKIIKDDSNNFIKNVANNSIDFLMIDSDHNYDNLTNDIKNWYHKIKPGGYIAGDDYGVFSSVTMAADDYFYGQINRGFRSFNRKKPRIQIKHMLTRPDDLREKVSMASLKQLENYGMVYQPIINKVFEGPAPKEHCRRPEHISKDNKPGELYPGAGLGWITGRHYGCYLAHRNALETMSDDYDYTLIFEADAYIHTGLEEFVEAVHKACFISERDDVYYIGLANNGSVHWEQINTLFAKTGHNQNLAHAYLIPNRCKQWYMDRLQDCTWDVADLWYNHVFYHHPKLRYTTTKMYSKQAEGYSLLDETIKTWN